MPTFLRALGVVGVVYLAALSTVQTQSPIGREVAIPRHLQDGEEYSVPLRDLVAFGKRLFTAVWTIEEGGGRPNTKGTGNPLSDLMSPLVFPRNFSLNSVPALLNDGGCGAASRTSALKLARVQPSFFSRP